MAPHKRRNKKAKAASLEKPAVVEKPVHVNDLPETLLQQVFGLLEFKDKMTLGLVCKQWNNIIQMPEAWSHLEFDSRKLRATGQFEPPFLHWLSSISPGLRTVVLQCSFNTQGIFYAILAIIFSSPIESLTLEADGHPLPISMAGPMARMACATSLRHLTLASDTTNQELETFATACSAWSALVNLTCLQWRTDCNNGQTGNWEKRLPLRFPALPALIHLGCTTSSSNFAADMARLRSLPRLQQLESQVYEDEHELLDAFPTTLWTLTSLTRLALAFESGTIVEVPQFTSGRLRNLRELILDCIQKPVLDDLKTAPSLTLLALQYSYDEADEFPEALYSLTKLNTLVVQALCRLELQPAITKLTNLRSLCVGNCREKVLPFCVTSLSSLAVIDWARSDEENPPHELILKWEKNNEVQVSIKYTGQGTLHLTTDAPLGVELPREEFEGAKEFLQQQAGVADVGYYDNLYCPHFSW